MKEKIKKLFGDTKEIFQNYKFTFILIVINTILMLFLYEEYDYNELLTALILSNILFFSVETFIKKDKPKLFLLLISMITSGILNHILYETNNTPRIPLLIIGIYIFIVLISIYKISKQEKNFANYFLKVVNNNITLAIASFVLELGLLFITFTISELLIPDSSVDIFLKMEILLFGLFIVPGEILCLTNTKKETLKPIKFLSCYILLPIVLISLFIIYSYFIKIIITSTIPSNQIFTIITILFIITIPTYILIINYDDNKFIKEVLNKLPYTLIPIIIMAMYSLGIRIYNHGITITRYYGIIIISLEIIFFILSLKRNHKYLHNLLLFSAILVLISMTIPYINCVSVSRTSQLNRLTSIYKENTIYDNLSNEEKDIVYSSYYYLTNELDSETYIPAYIAKEKITHNYIDYTSIRKNISYYNQDENIPVNGYNYIKVLSINEYNKEINSLQLSNIELYDNELDNNHLKKIFKDYLYNIIEEGEITNPEIILDDNYKIYLEEFHLSYNKETNKLYSINISGYLLTK